MTTQIQTFGIHRIIIKPTKHVYPGSANGTNFTVLSLELYNIKGERLPANISLYSAEEQSEVSFAPTEIITHD
jgi:hypothetical protein